MSFAVVIEGMTFFSFVVMIAGGKQKRESGWRILAGLLFLIGGVQCAGMALITYLYENDDRFFPGWRLDTSWMLCTISWSTMLLLGVAVISAALLLPIEGGYELIPDHHDEGELR